MVFHRFLFSAKSPCTAISDDPTDYTVFLPKLATPLALNVVCV